MRKKVLLTVLDGWGLAEKSTHNAIENAKTPNYDMLVREYPNTRLKADGEAVGLPQGQFGTSEVNHMTIGAGRVILQDLPRINHAIQSGEFNSNPALLKTINHVSDNSANLHLIGILSDGGVHTTTAHVFALFELLSQVKFSQHIYLHIFTDGRDVPPKSAEKYFGELQAQIAKYPELKIRIATIQGRAYLDRDRDWAKTEKAFSLMRSGSGHQFNGWQEVINYEYNQNVTDEYFGQYVIDKSGLISDNDGFIFYHYRTDRVFQIISRLIQEDLKNIEITTFIGVSEDFTHVNIAFPRLKIDHTLAEVISTAQLKQLHVTETEKYAHLTFFLNGEKEKELPHETWNLIESNRYIKPYYNYEPSMRNFDICKSIVDSIQKDEYSFIIANFSSPDMVGHTGDYHAAVISAQSVDFCLGKIYEAIKDRLDEYAWIITADHGNSEVMWDHENDQPHTQHTLSNVPFILVSDLDCKLHRRDTLADVAPTVLDLMGLTKPTVMTGESLIMQQV